jgi:4-amino-4-deoxy-L-arabinose transferase-like glycosyltransferase
MAAYAGSESLQGRLSRLAVVAAFAAITAFAGVWSLPPLDRDESRFAQATAQMLESGDYVSIRFQDDERNKKPVGVHWLQAASVSAFSGAEAREIWAYRLPSVAGAVLAALFTYLAGTRLYGPATGFLSALLIASAPLVAAESTIAKTDAVLLATTCAAQAAFVHIFARWRDREPSGWLLPIGFWLAIGAGVLVKGPIAPLIILLTACGMFVRAPQPGWALALKPATGAFILLLMVSPWALAIHDATDGRFFAEALGGDMFGKLGVAQEGHWGLPGYHLALVWLLFWPAAALLVPGIVQGYATRRAWPAWFLLSWAVPSWIVFELTATKLAHYTLPLYPALAILAARAASIGAAARRDGVHRFGAIVFLLVGALFAASPVALPLVFAEAGFGAVSLFGAALIAVGAASAALLFWSGRSYQGGLLAAVLAAITASTLLNSILPRLDRLHVSSRVSAALDDEDLHPLRDGAPPAAIAGYYEPSAVFLLGTKTRLTDAGGAAAALELGGAAIVEGRIEAEFLAAATTRGHALRALAAVKGLNYSDGREVKLTIYMADAPR